MACAGHGELAGRSGGPRPVRPRRVGDELRRAVVFIKEIVPRRAIAWIANLCYGEHYVTLPMEHQVALPGRIEYAWRHRGRRDRLAVTVAGPPAAAVPGSEAEFITEHYWGYAQRPGRATVEYQVEHPRWNCWRIDPGDAAIDVEFAALYGEALAPFLRAPPSSVLVADGSRVIVRSGRRLS